MGNSFFIYLQQLQLMVFFSGYPILYAVTVFLGTHQKIKNNFTQRLVSALPFAYALLGSLYIGFVLKNLYTDYSIENIKQWIHLSFLEVWGFLSVLFWIPAFAKKPLLSFLHSLVFFFILLKDLFSHFGSNENNIIRNDMNVYTISLLLNLGAFVLIVLLSFLFPRNRTRLGS
jgi:hypothetical protein